MKRVFLFFTVAAAMILNGCISTIYRGEDFPPTSQIEILPQDNNIPENLRIIGSGEASGEFSSASQADLLEKLKTLGMQHGARYMVVMGTRIVPAGKVADTGNEDFLTATDDPDQLEFESSMDNDLNPPRSRQTYKRIMYADFLR